MQDTKLEELEDDFSFDFTDEGYEEREREAKEQAEKDTEAARLRKQEEFVKRPTGNARCTNCGYEYRWEIGQRKVPPKTPFELVPSELFSCPKCNSPKDFFEPEMMTIAGFKESQSFGFGTNTMEGESKSNLVWGSLALGALILFSGYGFN